MTTFHSILFEKPGEVKEPDTGQLPDCFADLNLDQIIDAVTSGKREDDLKPFFYTPLTNVRAINYRHEVMRDLESDRALFESMESFAEKMVVMHRYLGLVDKLTFRQHQQGWFLEAVDIYSDAIVRLLHDLSDANPQSRGLRAFRSYLRAYVGSDSFQAILAEMKSLRAALATAHYCVLIKGRVVRVRKYQGEPDYSEEVLNTFEKFKQGAVKDYRARLGRRAGMNYVEAQILDRVAQLYPEIFANLEQFCTEHSNFLDDTIARFDREIQFYVAYLHYVAPLKEAGLRFCYPQVSATDKEVYAYDAFDLALGHKLLQEESDVVPNDFYLEGDERIIIVSGPNQGGKTTFARMFGQLHYLASLGCPVPGREAQLFLPDNIFTHFEREENIEDLRGKLQDDLVRIQEILDEATSQSIIVINEIFTSTTASDAATLGQKIMVRIIERDALCVCVTFIDELASLGEQTVSMVSTVVPENPVLRTFKIVRRRADGLAYAKSIAEKHRLTFTHLMDRIPS